jgi:hypothetical protein
MPFSLLLLFGGFLVAYLGVTNQSFADVLYGSKNPQPISPSYGSGSGDGSSGSGSSGGSSGLDPLGLIKALTMASQARSGRSAMPRSHS